MKKISSILLLIITQHFAQGQSEFFGQRFNLNYAQPAPALRNDRCNSGIRTLSNYGSNPGQYFFIATGTSFSNIALGVPPNGSDRLRFIRLDSSGAVANNVGHQFDYNHNGLYFNASGNSIAEIDNKAGNGGYMAVGAIADNPVTGAIARGAADILITRLQPNGAIINASLVDLNNPASGKDEAYCIRKSNILYQGQHTFILCGMSQRNQSYTDCFVARISAAGSVLWINRYNFDPTGPGQITAHCIARQLCEDAAGNIYVVGTLQDNQGANGIDGLAFALTQNGGVQWAKTYHARMDDEFQAIRLTVTGSLIVGGITDLGAIAPVTHHMLIVNLDKANGNILFQNILPANDGVSSYTSKCFDIIEVPTPKGSQYFLSGFFIKNNTRTQMMHITDKFGYGTNWCYYHAMYLDGGFGLCYDPSPCPGIAYFSSIKNPANPTFSDAHIMKTSLTGKSCNFHVLPSSKISINLQIQQQTARVSTGYIQYQLTYSSIGYQNKGVCNQTCAAMMAKVESSITASQEITSGSIRVSPNPVTNILSVQMVTPIAGKYQVALMDINGHLIQTSTQSVNSGVSNFSRDMSAIPSGVYLLIIRGNQLTLQQKVTKQ